MRKIGIGWTCLVACLACVGASAQDAPPADPLSKEIAFMRSLMVNAHAKLNRGLVEIEAADAARARPETPFVKCCSSNLERLDQGLATLRDAVQKASACYEQRRDPKGVDAAALAVQDLRSTANAYKGMADAADTKAASGSFDGAQRAFLNLTRSMAVMPPCGPWTPPPLPERH